MEQALQKSLEFRREVRKQTAGYITAGLGVVAGFAWNDAIKALIQVIFPLETDGLIAKFAYAIIITVVVVVVSLSFIRKLEEEPIAKD